MNENIFRAYDVRGNSLHDLTDDVVKIIGSVLGEYVREFGDNSIYLGHDSRLSKDRIKKEFNFGDPFCWSGCKLSWARSNTYGVLRNKKRDFESWSNDYGSHNPKEDNGLKIVIDGNSISGLEIKKRVSNYKYNNSLTAQTFSQDLTNDYLDEIKRNAPIGKPMKVILDAGNGAAGPLAKRVFENIGIDIISINEEPDGNFPNHHPDPGKRKNLVQLKEEIIRNDADIGFAFDGDGDRVGLVAKEWQSSSFGPHYHASKSILFEIKKGQLFMMLNALMNYQNSY